MKWFTYVLLIVLSITTGESYAQKRPNILLIVSDDLAFQAIGAYGSKLMQTPAIDRIAREGATFKKLMLPILFVVPAVPPY